MTVIGTAGQIQAQAKIRLGLSAVSALPSAVWIAEEKGLFRKHGLDTEIIVTGQGAIPVSARCSPTIFNW